MFGGQGLPGSESSRAAASGSPFLTPYHLVDFAAQESLIEIVPQCSMPRLRFLSAGDIGPFTPNYPMLVPLWLALQLRASHLCTVTPPPLLASVDLLQEAVKQEVADQKNFGAVAFHFFSIAKQLLRHAAADIPDSREVHRLIREWLDVRSQKLHRQLQGAFGDSLVHPLMSILNLTSVEVEAVRAVMVQINNDGHFFLAASTEPRPHVAVTSSSTPEVEGAPSARPGAPLVFGDETVSTTTVPAPTPTFDAGAEQLGLPVDSSTAAPKRRRTLRQR